MRGTILAFSISALVVGAGCSPISKTAKEELAQPVNCATAPGDIRILENEKAHVAEQVVNGVTAIAPAGAVLGIVTRTEGDKLEVATGEYDRKIAEIKRVCGL